MVLIDPATGWMLASFALSGVSNYLKSKSDKEQSELDRITQNRGLNLQGLSYLSDQRDKFRKMGDMYKYTNDIYNVLRGHSIE